MSTCKACGTLIEWVQTTTGKWMPLDPDPVHVIEGVGTDRFVTEEGQVITGRLARLEERSLKTPVAFVPHWRTCRGSGRFRRRIS